MTRQIGVLGGTFDPPHIGHLWLGETAHDQLGLDEVWYLPVGDPPHKDSRQITAVSHRLTMTHLATANFPHFYVYRTDIDRPPPHTTVSLMTCLHQTHPDATFWLIIGADSLRDFASWASPQQLITLCRPAVLHRPGVQIDWDALETAVPGLRSAVDWLHGPTVDISSTAIRAWAQEGRSLNVLVKTAVLSYIRSHQLYT